MMLISVGNMSNYTEIQSQLVQKINLDLTEGRTYEASQLCMSYIARKKDTLGKKGISDLIFHIAGYFCTNNGHSDAGTIIQWYIEDGASRGT